MTRRILYLLAVPALVFLLFSPSHAARFTAVSYDHLHYGITVSLDGVTDGISTVEFSVDLAQDGSGLSDIRAWCIDPWQPAALGSSLDIPVELVSPDMVPGGLEAAWLAANAGTYLSYLDSDYLKTAALQLAIWEVIAEKDGGFDLDAGNFQVLYGNGSADPAAEYLKALQENFNDSDKDYLKTHFAAARNDKYQDFILSGVNANPAATPEPGTLLLTGIGFLVLFLTRRRLHAHQG